MPELRLSSTFSRVRLLERIVARAKSSMTSNARTRGVMTTPPTVTDEGASLPAGQTNGYLLGDGTGGTRLPSDFHAIGTRIAALSRYKTAVVNNGTGGNSGQNNGDQCSLSKMRFLAEANKVTLRLEGSTLPYRFLVDGQYVDVTGTVPGATSGTRYISLDFTSAGGRKLREIVVEMQAAQAFVGVYVGATEKIQKAKDPIFKSDDCGDSWAYGSSATHLGDGIAAVAADYLGWDSNMQSGAPGAGWGTVTGYNHMQRVLNGDLGLNGTPSVIRLRGSINDKNTTAATITANLLAAAQFARTTYPNALIIISGVYPVAGGNGGTQVTNAQNEAAVLAAFNAFADPFSFYIPVGAAPLGSPLTGTGFVGSTTGTGNADVNMFDGSHLNTVGCAPMGRWEAEQIVSGCEALLTTLAAA